MRPKQFLTLLACLISAALICAVPALAGDYQHEYPGGETGGDVGYDAPCLAIDLDEERAADRACDDLPHFKSSFLNRIWTFHAAVDYFVDEDYHVLSVSLDRIGRLPARFRKQDDELLDQDAIVLAGSARVYENGKRVKGKDLGDAESALINGKLLAAAKWQKDEDGEPVPTIRAKRVQITS